MRVKTEIRKQSIIEAAIHVFREVGFQRATMELIARRLGGSKRTLYGYFQSKEELFEVAMIAAVNPLGYQINALLNFETEDLRSVLEEFASAYVSFVIGEDVLALARTAISEGTNSFLGAHVFEQGPRRALLHLTNFFTEQKRRGRVCEASPRIMSLHFKALIEAGLFDAALYGAEPELTTREAISMAVEAFIRAYGQTSLRPTHPVE